MTNKYPTAILSADDEKAKCLGFESTAEIRQAANAPATAWVQPQASSNTLQVVANLLKIAGAVSVDGGPVLTIWSSDDIQGDPDNQIAHFTWMDEELQYDCAINEDGVSAGSFAEDGAFTCLDNEGEALTLKFYELKAINPI